ncbi:GNAT family N-acetyltransferase [Rhodoferax sp. GW822-FHT02A01]|uniref:GNAT family N-acetyltransferase n=1 Tax=Rhodoferax sp. GW822-FHT02A01 TaxID=3141537 RepID=UPI00315CB939
MIQLAYKFSAIAKVAFSWLRRLMPSGTPIRTLGAHHRERIAAHLLALSAQDRYLRFGYPAQDAQILRYVQGLDFLHDEVLGIYDRQLKLVAVAHLAYGEEASEQCVEFGVSVLKEVRGLGYGARLFARAATHASNLGVRTMFIHALSENAAMLKIARAAGAHVQRDGSESQAYLQLPSSTVYSRFGELLQERIAKADFRLKVRAYQIRSLINSPSEVS